MYKDKDIYISPCSEEVNMEMESLLLQNSIDPAHEDNPFEF